MREITIDMSIKRTEWYKRLCAKWPYNFRNLRLYSKYTRMYVGVNWKSELHAGRLGRLIPISTQSAFSSRQLQLVTKSFRQTLTASTPAYAFLVIGPCGGHQLEMWVGINWFGCNLNFIYVRLFINLRFGRWATVAKKAPPFVFSVHSHDFFSHWRFFYVHIQNSWFFTRLLELERSYVLRI